MLSWWKIRRILKKDEVVTVGEFVRRYVGETLNPFAMDIYYRVCISGNPYLVIYDNEYPIKVKRRR